MSIFNATDENESNNNAVESKFVDPEKALKTEENFDIEKRAVPVDGMKTEGYDIENT